MRDGSTWTTDKDGLLLGLLAAEITATTGQDPARRFEALAAEHGETAYRRVDADATAQQKAVLKGLGPDDLDASEVAGDPVTRVLVRAPGNDEPFGGVKVETQGRLVRGAPVRHGGQVQGLRRVLLRRGPPGPAPRRRAGTGVRRLRPRGGRDLSGRDLPAPCRRADRQASDASASRSPVLPRVRSAVPE